MGTFQRFVWEIISLCLCLMLVVSEIISLCLCLILKNLWCYLCAEFPKRYCIKMDGCLRDNLSYNPNIF